MADQPSPLSLSSSNNNNKKKKLSVFHTYSISSPNLKYYLTPNNNNNNNNNQECNNPTPVKLSSSTSTTPISISTSTSPNHHSESNSGIGSSPKTSTLKKHQHSGSTSGGSSGGKFTNALKRVKSNNKLKKEIAELSNRSGLTQQYSSNSLAFNTYGEVILTSPRNKKDQQQRRSRFIEPVSQSTEDYSDIPKLIKLSIEYLFERSLKIPGLFRESANAMELKKLASLLESGEDVNLSEYNDHHSIGGLLKRYFRERPSPIFPYDLHKSIHSVILDDKSISKVKSLIIDGLSKGQFLILRYLFELLHAVDLNSEHNKMNSQNLAICFAPSLIHSYDSSCIDVVAWLIEQYESIFGIDILSPLTASSTTPSSSVTSSPMIPSPLLSVEPEDYNETQQKNQLNSSVQSTNEQQQVDNENDKISDDEGEELSILTTSTTNITLSPPKSPLSPRAPSSPRPGNRKNSLSLQYLTSKLGDTVLLNSSSPPTSPRLNHRKSIKSSSPSLSPISISPKPFRKRNSIIGDQNIVNLPSSIPIDENQTSNEIRDSENKIDSNDDISNSPSLPKIEKIDISDSNIKPDQQFEIENQKEKEEDQSIELDEEEEEFDATKKQDFDGKEDILESEEEELVIPSANNTPRGITKSQSQPNPISTFEKSITPPTRSPSFNYHNIKNFTVPINNNNNLTTGSKKPKPSVLRKYNLSNNNNQSKSNNYSNTTNNFVSSSSSTKKQSNNNTNTTTTSFHHLKSKSFSSGYSKDFTKSLLKNNGAVISNHHDSVKNLTSIWETRKELDQQQQ
eukprot:gene4058-5080_t